MILYFAEPLLGIWPYSPQLLEDYYRAKAVKQTSVRNKTAVQSAWSKVLPLLTNLREKITQQEKEAMTKRFKIMGSINLRGNSTASQNLSIIDDVMKSHDAHMSKH